MADFRWSEASERAAQLVVQGNLTYPSIAEAVGISRVTLYRWRRHPDFQARVDETLGEIRADIRRVGIATKARRVQALNDRWTRMRKVIEERADSPEMKDVPGGTTGLIVADLKGLGSGDNFTLVPVYSVDTALLRELREHERQAAQELGQWADKHEHAGPDGGPVQNAVVIYLPDNGRDRADAGDPPTPTPDPRPGDIPVSTQEREKPSYLLTTCPDCDGQGYDPNSYPESMSLATALKYNAVKFCPTCGGRKVVVSPDGRALIEFLKFPDVARELGPVFADATPDPSRPGLQGISSKIYD